MRFYTSQHRHYCGIDLHARTMYVCILGQDETVLVEKNIRARPEPFLVPSTEAPFAEYEAFGVEDPRICRVDDEYLDADLPA